MSDNIDTIRQLNVGSLRIRYKEDDYTRDKSVRKTIKISLFLLTAPIVFLIVLGTSLTLIDEMFPNIILFGKILITLVLTVVLLVILFAVLLKILSIVYENKEGLYSFLDFIGRLQDCDIFYNNEKRAFIVAFRDASGVKFYSKNEIKDFLQIEDDNFAWNDSNLKNLNDKVLLAIDLTEYPKTKCTILQEP